VSGRSDEYLKRAADLLRGTRWEPEVNEIQDAIRRGEQALSSSPGDEGRWLLLLRTSEILNSMLSFEEIVPRLMDLVIRFMEAERGIIFLLDDKDRFHPAAQANVESQCVEDAMEYSANILRRAAEDHILWSGNAVGDKRFSQYESIAAYNIKSFMCVPLKRRGKIVGTIYVDNRSLENSFDAKDLEFLRILANHAGVAIENAKLHDRLKAENKELRTEIKKSIGERIIVGDDPKIKRILDIVDRVADSEATVLVTGESGTGKELIARAIHQQSARLGHPLVTLNCAAIPEHLLESELFGYVKGAFTGAQGTKVGKFEAAHLGTLFLDEIGDMSFPLQAKILRVLQEGVFEPLGSNTTKEVDVRIVAATNRNLAQMVEAGTFREDLYYRLNVIVLDLPPLRARRDDLPKLALHFLAKCSVGKTVAREFSPEAMELMKNHSWPGNIRELENCIMRLALLAPHEVIEPEDVAPYLEGRGPTLGRPAAATVEPNPVTKLDDLERDAIVAALSKFEGNRTAAAQALGISVRKLQYKIKEYQEAGLNIG
jgi:transcriptional regulator with GAF, ATPase, and Fis domain